MAKNQWLQAYGRKPIAAGNYEFIWVNFDKGGIELIHEGDECDWIEVTHWQPTQIRTPRPLTIL